MCVIVVKPAGVEPIKKEYLSKAWDSNSHGAGVVFKAPKDEVKMKKGFMEKQDFMDYMEKINTKENGFIAHFRIKSVGEIKPENCHPFVLKNVTFAHNGTLHISPLEGKTDSETFGLAVFKNHTMNWIKENQLLIEMALNTSKFAVMDNKTGEIFILNKDLGKERDGCWFSNESAFPVKPVTNYSNYTNWNYQNEYNNSSSSSTYKPQANWGTKNWKEWGSSYSDLLKCWINNYTGLPQRPLWSAQTMVTNQKGFWIISKDIVPDKSLVDHKYAPNDDIVRMVIDEQSFINRMLDDYRGNTYTNWNDREYDEEGIKQRYFVLNGIRRLIAAGKEVNADSLYSFVYGNVQPADSVMSEYQRRRFSTFDSAVAELVEEWVENIATMEDDEPAPKQQQMRLAV